MVQGTTSNAGKSLLCAGLCRIFARDGLRVAPFKSQNMALNSFVTADGLEMGRAQVTQAQCAGKEPDVRMNPILLKPTSDSGSQVIVNGEVIGNMAAREYYAYKHNLVEKVLAAYESLAAENDVIVIEGAGSPAEINLKQGDLVNMGLAKMVGAPVLLAGDIDRGGVFASLAGTHLLLEEDERALLKGVIINKFRGDKSILAPGLTMLEEIIHTPVVGVVPFMQVDIDDEDSLTDRFTRETAGILDIAVIRTPRISNFTDFGALAAVDGVSVRYIGSARELGAPDLVILPGSKNTMGDLLWLRQSGLEAAVLKFAAAGGPVLGICGGYQMLGRTLRDPLGVENGGEMAGLGLLPAVTTFSAEKTRTQVRGRFGEVGGVLSGLSGTEFTGYEIHMGVTETTDDVKATALIEPGGHRDGMSAGNVYGTYIHGILDGKQAVEGLLGSLLRRRGLNPDALHAEDPVAYRERQFDILEGTLRESLDMKAVYDILEKGAARTI